MKIDGDETPSSAIEVTRPDFTGSWRFDPSRSRLEITPPEETLFVIEHREPVFRFSRTHVAAGRSDTFSLELTTDGREVTVDSDGLFLRACATWDGDALLIESRVVRGGEEGTNVVRYVLSEDRNTFVAEESFRSASLNYDNVWFLERIPPAP